MFLFVICIRAVRFLQLYKSTVPIACVGNKELALDSQFAFYDYEDGMKLSHLVYKEDSPTCFCYIHSHYQEQSWRVRSYPKKNSIQKRRDITLLRGYWVERGLGRTFFFYNIFWLAKRKFEFLLKLSNRMYLRDECDHRHHTHTNCGTFLEAKYQLLFFPFWRFENTHGNFNLRVAENYEI